MKLALAVLVIVPAWLAGDLREAVKLLESRDPRARSKAVGMLEEIPGERSLLLVIRALADEAAEVRSRARRVLSMRKEPDDLALIARKGLGHRDPRARLACVEALVRGRPEGLDAVLVEAVLDSDPGIREAAAGHIVTCMGVRGLETLAAAVSRDEGRPCAAALLALSRLDEERARGLARGLLADRTYEVRVAALEVLSDIVAAMTGLDDEVWSVRLTAIRTLARLREAEAIPPLIAALERERGRLRLEVGEALTAITGMGLPPDPDRWADWWEEAREGYALPEAPAEAESSHDDTVATFHSIPVVSDCSAFVLDRSKSMSDRLERHEGRTKGELVAEELTKTLRKLKSPARFFLVTFGTEPKAFTSRPVKATSCARGKAVRWLEKQPPGGRTNLFDALALALDRKEIDTIFLLTDGAPSAGEYRGRREILMEVARRNRFRKAVIHTVEIGAESTGKRWRGFMADLARESGGFHGRR
jgi:HEAT repeat protein